MLINRSTPFLTHYSILAQISSDAVSKLDKSDASSKLDRSEFKGLPSLGDNTTKQFLTKTKNRQKGTVYNSCRLR